MGRGREAGFIDVAVFGKPGEAAARVLSQGWLVAVYGRLAFREWEAPDGGKRTAYSVIGNVEFFAAPRGGEEPPTVGAGVGNSARDPIDAADIPF